MFFIRVYLGLNIGLSNQYNNMLCVKGQSIKGCEQFPGNLHHELKNDSDLIHKHIGFISFHSFYSGLDR